MNTDETVALVVSVVLVIVGFAFVAKHAKANREGREKDARRALRTAIFILPVCFAAVITWAALTGVRF